MKTSKPGPPRFLAPAALAFAAGLTTTFAEQEPKNILPRGFVDVQEVIPGIHADLRYCTEQNFVGKKIEGYHAPRVILTRQAAEALALVQADLEPFGLGLKIFDAYRPQRAVNHFMRWARDFEDTATKPLYYPNIPKERLFREEYIAEFSSHSRGSTVDLTIVTRPGGEELDMGGNFDFFDPVSWITEQEIPAAARAHRLLLHNLMLARGFSPYPREWWHFTLRDEPFPKTYFNFVVE